MLWKIDARVKHIRMEMERIGCLALENAASVAMMMLTTECIIANKKQREAATTVPET